MFLIGLPLLYGVGRCAWLWRRDGLARPVALPAAGVIEPLHDSRYGVALEAARHIRMMFARHPDVPPSARLADLTYVILGAICHIEELRQTSPFYAEPSVN